MGLINFTTDEFQEHQYVFTKYSLFHFAFGLAWFVAHYALFKKQHLSESFILMNIMHAIFEILENTPFAIEFFRKHPLWKNYDGDSKGNSIGDIISGIFGFLFGILMCRFI